MGWSEDKIAALEQKAGGVIAEYERLHRLAEYRSGDSRAELLYRMEELSTKHERLIMEISRLRGRVRI